MEGDVVQLVQVAGGQRSLALGCLRGGAAQRFVSLLLAEEVVQRGQHHGDEWHHRRQHADHDRRAAVRLAQDAQRTRRIFDQRNLGNLDPQPPRILVGLVDHAQ